MLRCMILLFSFLLITLSAVHLGQDETLVRTLGLRPPPAVTVQEEAKEVPIAPSSRNSAPRLPSFSTFLPPAPSASSASSNASASSALSAPPASTQAPLLYPPEGRPPRFVLDEPIPEYSFPLEPGQEPGVSSLDPSAHALVSPAESQGEYVPPILTEEQKLQIAEPFVKELFALKENSLRAISELGDQAIGDYLAADPSARSAALPAIAARYLPQVQTITAQSDQQAEDILLRMTAALAAIGADDGIAQDARDAYNRSKQEAVDRYTQIFSELPS